MRMSPYTSWTGSDIPAVWALIVIKFVFFAVQALFPSAGVPELLAWVITPQWLTHVQPWQCVTYTFVHRGFLDLLFDIIVLVFFGGILERAWGTLRFVGFYFMCGIVSGLAVLGMTFLGQPGGVFTSMTANFVGLGVAYGAMNPSAQVYLWFVLPIQARWLGLASAVLELLLNNGSYGGALNALVAIGACTLFAWTFTRGISWRPRGGGGGPTLKERFERWRQRQRMRAWQRKVSKIDKPDDLFK
jgi:membrane associated rhomboid family serine protease